MWRLLVFAVVIGGALYAALRFTPKKLHRLVFIAASFIPVVFILIRLIYRAVALDNLAYTLQAVPFTLCGITCILLVIVAFTQNKIAYNLNYFISMPATVFAVLLDNTSSSEPWSLNFWCFVVPHLFYLFVPLYMALFKYMKPEIKMIPKTVLTFGILIIVMHGLNSLLSWVFPTDNGFPTTNFIYTMFPGDNNGPPVYDFKNFPLLINAWNIMPVKGLYLLLLSPILAVMLFVLSLPLIKPETYKKLYYKIFKRKKYSEAESLKNKDSTNGVEQSGGENQ